LVNIARPVPIVNLLHRLQLYFFVIVSNRERKLYVFAT
jgi:hypothetical protein